uniref:BPTI/Kunitz inhibitor domain-containing protein n=1 Tax=Buteo japonicus TaxID=224669 RepID=A0A8C0BDJ0_9AVES
MVYYCQFITIIWFLIVSLILLLGLLFIIPADFLSLWPWKLCSLPKAVGQCRASMPRWWFNITGGLCQSFVFGGCKGNANNFLTERECQESCVLGGATLGAAESLSPHHHFLGQRQENLGGGLCPTYPSLKFLPTPAYCTVPRVTGPCRASFLRWYYSPANRTCRQFIYGGCRGNKNNYQHEEECLKRCTILLGYVTDIALKTCRRKPELPGVGTGWSPSDYKEYLMSNAYTL